MSQGLGSAVRQLVDGNAVIVRNAFLGSVGPLNGTFEIFDPDYCVTAMTNGMVRITVTCSAGVDSDSDFLVELTAMQWECLTVVGYDGPVISHIAHR